MTGHSSSPSKGTEFVAVRGFQIRNMYAKGKKGLGTRLDQYILGGHQDVVFWTREGQ